VRSLSPSTVLAAGPTRLEVVPLHAVVGTVESTANFDLDFRPASNALRHRWERIALAHRKGHALPPVVLRRQPDGYYVVDGRHRISVARALRQRDIDAWVSGLPRSLSLEQANDRARSWTPAPQGPDERRAAPGRSQGGVI
jgi:hypothetical protein